ncbi:DUF4176 domain-containing protein [Lactococcus sp. S64]|uniref:DUF4176 domain-containing protein n=1 Tax=Lactococcus sp. S64 TaxID=2767459 RepID=UPI0019075A05|nr:DUF4176 domain-containing protein [Lactococcus sp. S64]MBK0084293.1 DUF4176 domain-containing protein [Lactococcus sp. S64]
MLPIGSIIYLSEGNQKIMILNRGPIVEQNEEKVLFDYTGAIYPNGLDPEQVYYFNDEDIDEVVFEGYKDGEEKRFIELYSKWREKNSNLKKGNSNLK